MEQSPTDFIEMTPHLQQAAEKAAQDLIASGHNTKELESCDGMILVRHNSPEFKEREEQKGVLLFPVQFDDETFFVSLS